MFCSQCGKKATGKFCSSCGNSLQPAAAGDALPIAADWTKVFDYEALIRVPEIRERIAQSRRADENSTVGRTVSRNL